jgi:hypothetical protein
METTTEHSWQTDWGKEEEPAPQVTPTKTSGFVAILEHIRQRNEERRAAAESKAETERKAFWRRHYGDIPYGNYPSPRRG